VPRRIVIVIITRNDEHSSPSSEIGSLEGAGNAERAPGQRAKVYCVTSRRTVSQHAMPTNTIR
jgi:hypothetical protein